MSNRTRKITCIGMGALLAMAAGAPPAMADDTELMLLMPDVETVKPNILFMLDTSGSMDDEVRTKRPYDPAHTYSGGTCDSNAVYWTEVDVTPNCESNQWVSDSAFLCNAASGQLMGIGSYTDTMVQRREAADGTAMRWQELEAGNSTGSVECMADSGEHGAGIAGDVYAVNDDSSTGFTSDSNRELAWGSTPATVTYTVYDGNYLNWKSTAAEEDVRKIEVLQAVTTAVLNSVSDVNVGIMRFNGNNGGVVIQAISDLDTHRDAILQTVDSLTPQGNTPLAEVMYEGALYWRGQQPHFVDEDLDLDAIDAVAETYRMPETQACSKNYNIMLSDGQPRDDTEESLSLAAANLPGFAECDGSGTGACLDDIAAYLANNDINGDPDDGDQVVTTHTIGFSMDIPTLQETANDADGTYYRADDVETLTNALLEAVSNITTRSLSFTAPAISVNSFNRTQNLNDLYITVFAAEPNVHWPGNLKKYKVAEVDDQLQIVDAAGVPAINSTTGFFLGGDDGAQSLWQQTDENGTPIGPDGADVEAGGAAHQLPLPDARKLLSNTGSGDALEAVTSANLAAAGVTLGLTGAAGEPTQDELVQWMHGVDIRDENPDSDYRYAMGDPLHSQPAAVVYGGTAASPEVVVFVGTNDGYLHAIDGSSGQELWSFVPKELLDDMNRLFFNPRSNFKHYGIDGSIVPVVFDRNNNGIIERSSPENDFVYLVFGLRRGGSSYYALDVSDKNNPVLKWVQDEGFGQTWSTPVIARVDTDDNDDPDSDIRTRDAVVIVGGGYDPVHDTPAAPVSADVMGNRIVMLDLETGDPVWSAGPDVSDDLTIPAMTRAFPSQIRVVDMSGDGFADRMYAADVAGRIWRFDITNGASTLVAGGIIADLGAAGTSETPSAVPRRFYNAPDVAIFNDPVAGRRFISISIGSGYRAHPLNEEATDRFFSVRDPNVFNRLGQLAYNNYDVVTVDDLAGADLDTPATIGTDDHGWYFDLPAEQAVLADSTTFNDAVLFVAFTPDVNTSDPCLPTAGRNFLYQVGVVNGNFAVNNLDSPIDTDPDDNVTEIAQGGIASTPAVLFPGSTNADCEGAECREPPIFCVGAECFDSGFANNPVRTLWTQDGIE